MKASISGSLLNSVADNNGSKITIHFNKIPNKAPFNDIRFAYTIQQGLITLFRDWDKLKITAN